MHINMILPPAYLMLQLFINGVGDGWRTEDSVSGSGANNAWVLIAVVNVTFTLVMWTWEVLSEIIEDEIPEAMKAAIVLCFR